MQSQIPLSVVHTFYIKYKNVANLHVHTHIITHTHVHTHTCAYTHANLYTHKNKHKHTQQSTYTKQHTQRLLIQSPLLLEVLS